MSTVLITGGTGLIGEQLNKKLKDRGYEVAILSRARSKEEQLITYIWDINKFEIEKEAIATADFIIHLSGSSIGEKRWTTKRKQEIIDSRIKSGQLIFDEIREQNKNLKAFISGFCRIFRSKTINSFSLAQN